MFDPLQFEAATRCGLDVRVGGFHLPLAFGVRGGVCARTGALERVAAGEHAVVRVRNVDQCKASLRAYEKFAIRPVICRSNSLCLEELAGEQLLERGGDVHLGETFPLAAGVAVLVSEMMSVLELVEGGDAVKLLLAQDAQLGILIRKHQPVCLSVAHLACEHAGRDDLS